MTLAAQNMIRIAQISPSVDAPSGGTTTAFLGVLSVTRAQPGLDVRALSTAPPETDPNWQTIRTDRAARGETSWVLTPSAGRLLLPKDLGRTVAAAVRAGEFDLLHLHGIWSPDLLHIANAARAAAVPYVWQPHGMLVGTAIQQKRFKKELFLAVGMAKALRSAAALIFCTQEERDQSRPPSGITAVRQHVVPLPLEVPENLPRREEMSAAARKRFGIPAAAPTIVFMGRLHPVKQVELTLEAVAAAAKSLPDLHLLLIGDGERDYVAGLKATAARLGIADRVRFAGFVLGPDKWPALAAGDVLTLNSRHENFGFVAVEALCVGTPPVLTSTLALAPELAAAGAGVSCDATAAALAAAYLGLLNDPDRAGIVARGRAWVDTHLSAQAVGGKLAELYRAVLAQSSR